MDSVYFVMDTCRQSYFSVMLMPYNNFNDFIEYKAKVEKEKSEQAEKMRREANRKSRK